MLIMDFIVAAGRVASSAFLNVSFSFLSFIIYQTALNQDSTKEDPLLIKYNKLMFRKIRNLV